jgi:uncharacterized membrane protein YdjX (TVP38/TMEM64 family)
MEALEPVDGRVDIHNIDCELSADLSAKEQLQPRLRSAWLDEVKTSTRMERGQGQEHTKHHNADASRSRLEDSDPEQGKQPSVRIPSTFSEDYLGRSPPENENPTRTRLNAEIRDLFHELVTYAKTKSWKKKVLTVLVSSSSLLVLVDLIFFGNIVHWLRDFILWMRTHIIQGIFAFIGLFVFTTLVFIPPSILTFGCGFILADVCGLMPGIIAATMACFIGSVIGAMICFLRARYMMRDLVELFARRYTVVRAIDKAIKRNGFRVMALLRLCPLIPFHALNYIGGITAVSWESFLFSLIGILPLTILTVTIGATTGRLVLMASEGSQDQQLIHILLICSGLSFLIIAMAITYYFAKKELQQELEAAASSSSLNDQPDEVEELQIATEEVDDEEWFWMFT